MADRTDYKHIKVTECDDDVVIVAGVAQSDRSGSACEGRATAPSSQDAQPEHVGDRSVMAHTAGSDTLESTEGHAEEDAYQRTTLDDIEQSKMPLTQKIVISVAVLAVIAFIIWYWIF